MNDFFENSEQFSRLDSLNAKRGKRRRAIMLVLLSALVVIAVVVTGFLAYKVLAARSAFDPEPDTEASISTTTAPNKGTTSTSDQKKTQALEETETPPSKPTANVLIVGVQDINGKRIARGILLAKIDTTKRAIQAVNIPDRTYLTISGLGPDQISQSFNMGLASTQKTVEDLLHIKVDSHVIMHYEDFEYLVSDMKFQLAYDRAVETNLFDEDKKAYSRAVSKLDPSAISITPLPVKYMSINGEPFYEPNSADISRLVESVWGIKIEVQTQPVRIIVLNGSGEPGVGKSVSDKLAPSGFVVIDVKNASSFSYKKTEIVAYKQEFMDKAKQIQQILGVGEAVYHPVSQDVAEIAIIVGQDFK